MYYSTDGATWTTAGANFLSSFPADADNTGFASAPGATVSVSSQTPVFSPAIPSAGEFYLAWNYSVASGTTTSNAQELAIDNFSIDNPLSVTLATFTAEAQANQIQVTWETLSEANNAGFNLYRADDAAGPQTLLTYVPSQAPGSTQGFAYSYDDLAVQPGQTYWYWLEDVSLSGATTLHGPVSATVSVPTAVTLASLQATPLAPAIPAATAALAGLAGLMAAAGVAVSRRRAR